MRLATAAAVSPGRMTAQARGWAGASSDIAMKARMKTVSATTFLIGRSTLRPSRNLGVSVRLSLMEAAGGGRGNIVKPRAKAATAKTDAFSALRAHDRFAPVRQRGHE